MVRRASIWSVTTGAAALPGRWPIAFRSGWRRSPRCRGRIPRLQTRAADHRRRESEALAAKSQGLSGIDAPMSCWPTMPDGCASDFRVNGVPASAIARHLAVLGTRTRWRGRWPVSRARRDPWPLGPIRVPTLFIWGDADRPSGRGGRRHAGFVAVPDRFEVCQARPLAADQAPDRLSELLLAQVEGHPVRRFPRKRARNCGASKMSGCSIWREPT